MSGRMSRNKGKRVEYEVRDHVRSHGYDSYRVPLSGASEGVKGDVKVTSGGKEYTIEVKARQSAFKRIYQLFDRFRCGNNLRFTYNGSVIEITTSFHTILEADRTFRFFGDDVEAKHKSTLNRFSKLKEFLKGADVLAIKDNNQPLLFISWS